MRVNNHACLFKKVTRMTLMPVVFLMFVESTFALNQYWCSVHSDQKEDHLYWVKTTQLSLYLLGESVFKHRHALTCWPQSFSPSDDLIILSSR